MLRLLPLAAPISLCLTVTAPAAAQLCPDDDAFAGNGTFGTAAPIDVTPAGIELAPLAITPGQQSDVFSFSLDPGETFISETIFSHAQGNIDVYIVESGSGIFLDEARSLSDDEFLEYRNWSAATMSLLFLVNANTCVDYGIRASRTACPGDDRIVENFDSCSNAFPLGAPNDSIDSLAVLATDDDFFTIDVMPGETFMFEIAFNNVLGDLDLELFDRTSGSCGAPIDTSESTSDQETVSFQNTTGAPMTLVARVFVVNAGASCNGYSAFWSVASGPACFTPDALEDEPGENNDDLCNVSGLPRGGLNGLTLSALDPDFYQPETLGAGERISVGVDFIDADGDIDLRLWDVTNGCANAVLLGTSESSVDFEELSHTNNTGAAQIVVAEVYLLGDGCNSYSISNALGPVDGNGDVSCFVDAPNSTGQFGVTSIQGSPFVSDNAAVLAVREVPPQMFGIFVTSRETGYVPNLAGGNGTLCLGGTIGRYQQPHEIVLISLGGEAELAIDLTAMPQGAGPVAAQPGETWYFQFWHRDLEGGVPNSNTADATRIRFQ